MKDINLFRAYQKEPQERQHLIKQIRISLLLFLIVYCLVTASIFSYWLILRMHSKSLVTRIDSQKQRLEELKPVENLYVFLKQRLSSLVPFFEERKVDYQKMIAELQRVKPEGVVYQEIGIEIDGDLSVSGEAPNVSFLSELLDNLLVLEGDGILRHIEVVSVRRSEEGFYSFDLEIDAQV